MNKILVLEAFWWGLGRMQVNSQCGPQKRWNALAEMHSLNPSAIVYGDYLLISYF